MNSTGCSLANRLEVHAAIFCAGHGVVFPQAATEFLNARTVQALGEGTVRVHIHLELAAAATSLFLNFLLPSQAVLMHAGLMDFLLPHASRALAIAVGGPLCGGSTSRFFSEDA